MNKNIIITLVVAVAVGAMGFVGGMKYEQMQTPVAGNRQFAIGTSGGNSSGGRQGRFAGTGGGNTAGFRPIMGNILSVDKDSITVKMQDGSSKIVLLPSSAMISKTDAGDISDLKVGETVGVFGTTNSDGSVTAQNVQLNPMYRVASGSAAAR